MTSHLVNPTAHLAHLLLRDTRPTAHAKAKEPQYKLKNFNGTSSNSSESIFIKSGYEQFRVKLEEILFVKSIGNYMQFVFENRKITCRITINEVETLLPSSDFIRIHRSYIVAKKHIWKMDKKSIWIKQTEIPIGSAYSKIIEKLSK